MNDKNPFPKRIAELTIWLFFFCVAALIVAGVVLVWTWVWRFVVGS